MDQALLKLKKHARDCQRCKAALTARNWGPLVYVGTELRGPSGGRRFPAVFNDTYEGGKKFCPDGLALWNAHLGL